MNGNVQARAEGLRPTGFLGHVIEAMRMVKIEHTLFALPFALLGLVLAARGLPTPRTLLWVVVCMVGARSAAMTFNRILDRHFDARNPRTRDRSLPAGRVSPAFAYGVTVASSALFIFGAGMLNRTCLLLSPVALAVILGYSATKRFTSATHLVLGLALAIAPAGAWIAVRGSLEATPLLLSLAVALWVAGFDILYACQDVEFDRREGLHSLPAAAGLGPAMVISGLLHLGMLGALAAVGFTAGLSWMYALGLGFTALILGYAHWIVRPHALGRLQVAFFTTNVAVGLTLLGATFLDLMLLTGI
jgi:4-hydroxybenzoate polyprenyltransferase